MKIYLLRFLKDTFFILFIIYYVFTIIDLFKNKDKKSKTTKDNSKENGNDTNDNGFAFKLIIFVVFVIIALLTLFFASIFALSLNLLMAIASSIGFLFLLIRSLLSENYSDLYSFDQFNSLSLFCIATVVAVTFKTHNFLLVLIQNFIKNTYLHDFFIILFFFAAYFINIFFIFTLSSSFFIKLKDKLQELLDKVVSKADEVKKDFHLSLKEEKDKKCFSINLKTFKTYLLTFLFVLWHAVEYLFLSLVKLCFRFLIGFSSNNDLAHLSFNALISLIFSLILSYACFTINKPDKLIGAASYDIFEFVSGTFLIPLIYDCINKYATKVKKAFENKKSKKHIAVLFIKRL